MEREGEGMGGEWRGKGMGGAYPRRKMANVFVVEFLHIKIR